MKRLDSVTKGFVIAASAVVIGWAGISAYNHWENARKEDAFRTCNTAGIRGLWESGLTIEAGIKLNECLAKYNLQVPLE